MNEEKSKIAKSDGVKFLEMTTFEGLTRISKAAYNKAMEKLMNLIPRDSHQRLEKAIEQFNNWCRGWGAYFSMTQFPSQLAAIEAHASV